MHNLIVLVAFAMLAWSQGPAVVPAKPSLPVPRLDKGVVEGNTYKNASVGIELTLDSKLKFTRPELTGKPGTVPLSVTVSAWGKFRLYTAREGTTFLATALAYYPDDQRSSDACMRRVMQANQGNGWKLVQGSGEGELGGILFARTDFLKVFKEGKEGTAYEAAFVKACNTQALIFVFAGANQDAVNKLIAATGLKLDLARSGCRLKTTAATQE